MSRPDDRSSPAASSSTRVGSTNDVVRGWLADGTPEVCLAVAGEQTAGRGREGRTWVAPPGAALLLSLGFRPTWLEPDAAWRLAAVASLAMADAAEAAAGLAPGTIRLKWPNDLVLETPDGASASWPASWARPTASGTADPRVVVGLGINTDWAAADFPPELAGSMTSLREAATGGRSMTTRCSTRSSSGSRPRVAALRAGRFDGAGWADRQVTTGRHGPPRAPDGAETVRATGVDPATGGAPRRRRTAAAATPGPRRRDHPRPARRPVAEAV